MALQFTTTASHALASGIKVCVHGKSGAGKTRLCATCPRPLILSAEQGTLSIAKENLPMLRINNMAQMDEAYAYVAHSAEARQRFDTVCLDSISEMAEKFLSEEKAKTKDPRQAYGEMADKIAVMIRLWRDLPGFNVYFSCKSALVEQPGGMVAYGPMMPGKQTAQGLAYFFDEFLYLGKGETVGADGKKIEYGYLQTREDTLATAKDRSGTLDLMEPPNLTHIFNKIRAQYVAPAV